MKRRPSETSPLFLRPSSKDQIEPNHATPLLLLLPLIFHLSHGEKKMLLEASGRRTVRFYGAKGNNNEEEAKKSRKKCNLLLLPDYQDKTNKFLKEKRLSLSSDVESIIFEFSLLNYQNVEKTRYQWKLEGMDKNWNCSR